MTSEGAYRVEGVRMRALARIGMDGKLQHFVVDILGSFWHLDNSTPLANGLRQLWVILLYLPQLFVQQIAKLPTCLLRRVHDQDDESSIQKRVKSLTVSIVHVSL